MTKKCRLALFSILALTLCLTVALGAFSVSFAQADEASIGVQVPSTASVWDGNLAAAGWSLADSTENTAEAPATYKVDASGNVTIEDAKAFAWFAHEASKQGNHFKGKTVTLGCDIDLNNNLWIPIGFSARDNHIQSDKVGYDVWFEGIFDGGNHTVYNFSSTKFMQSVKSVDSVYHINNTAIEADATKQIDEPFPTRKNEEFPYGLFGVIGNATVKNLSVVNVDINDNELADSSLAIDIAGAIAGYAAGKATFINCQVGSGLASAKDTIVSKAGKLGGIVGQVYGCANKSDGIPYGDESKMPSGSEYDYQAVRFENCVNYANVNSAKTFVGGMVGYVYYTNEVSYISCKNYGDIVGDDAGGLTSRIMGVKDKTSYDYEIIDCENYGNITTNEENSVTGKYHTGGMVAMVQAVATTASPVGGMVIDKCVNYGAIKQVPINGSDKTSYVGGMVGFINGQLSLQMTDCFNMGNLVVEDGNVGGGYTHIGGLIGTLGTTIEKISGGNVGEYVANRGCGNYTSTTLMAGHVIQPADAGKYLYLVDGSSARVAKATAPYNGHAVAEAPTQEDVASAKTLTYGNDGALYLVDDANAKTKVTKDELLASEQKYKLVVDDDVTVIPVGAFAGLKNLVAVELNNVTEISSFAFAGTGLGVITLPTGLTEIGAGAFAQVSNGFKSVVVPSSVTNIGKTAFGNNGNLNNVEIKNIDTEYAKGAFESGLDEFYILVSNAQEYDVIKDKELGEYATYPVTVEYYDLSVSATVPVGSEIKLYGKPYTMSYNLENSLWSNNVETINYVGLPVLGAGETPWYSDDSCSTASLNVDAVSQLLNADNVETVKLYTRLIGESDEFVARVDLVFDGVEYPLGAINALLASRSKKVTDETVAITAYTKFDKSEPETTVPASFLNAGVYTVQIGESEITITIAKAKIYLANISTLEWRINDNITLLDRDGLIDSVVRSRGAEVELTLSLYNATAKGYIVSNPVNATQIGAGECDSKFTLTTDDNHEFVDGTVVNAEARGLTVTLNDDGTVTVDKKWRVVDMDNWFVGADGNDYVIADRVYGSTATFSAPKLVHGANNDITLELYQGGRQIGQMFTVDEFSKYFNNMIHVGDYTLYLSAKAVDYDEYDYDENGVIIEESKRTLHCSAIERHEVNFTVTPAMLNAEQVTAINEALNGKTFKFIVGVSNVSADNTAVQNAVNSALEQLRRYQPSVTIEGNVWTANTATITVNPAVAMSNVYGGFTKPSTAGVYNYYYKLSLANYNSVDASQNKLLVFTVVAYGEVEIPTVAGKVFNNTQQTADIVGNGQYNVTVNNGGITAGEYDVTLTLLQPECYLWKGQTVDNATAQQTLKFAIAKADNSFTVALNILGWNYETFDSAVNNIRASVRYLDNGQNIIFRVVKKGETTPLSGLDSFTVDENGKVNTTIAQLLNNLKVGEYVLYAKVNGTVNYNELERNISFAISKSINTWADGEDDLVLPSWIVGTFNLEENIIAVKSAHGEAIIEIRDMDGNVYYNSATPEENTLNTLDVGKYLLVAWVPESDDYSALAERSFTIEVLEKIGLPWWGTTLIAVGALGLAFAIILILWKLKVFEILTDKISLAITTRATVDATIAAVRATKKAEEAEAHKRKVEARERLEQAREAQRNKTPEQRAQELAEKAEVTATRADKLHKRADKLRERADKLAGNSQDTADESPNADTDVDATDPDTADKFD